MNSIFRRWITDGSGSPFYVRKKFTLKSHVKKAEAYVAGLGQFNLYVNGEAASDHRLDSAWTNYRETVYYITFKLTDKLHKGDNVLAAEVGNGWYLMDTSIGYSFHFPAFMPESPNPYVPFGKQLIFGACIYVEYEDGTEEMIYADEGSFTAPHPVLHTNVFGSEVMDGGMKIEGWNSEEYTQDSCWTEAVLVEENEEPAGKLKNQWIPSIRVTNVYPGKLIGKVNGRLIYDFGRNMSGILKAKVRGEIGKKVVFRPAEKLNADGDVDQMAKGWMMIDVVEEYWFGKNREFEDFSMTFTYFGGRYVSVEGVSEEDICDVTAEAISSAFEDSGKFECDDERYMQIYKMIRNSIEANMMSVHTDCPTIERFAWQEENVMMAQSLMYMKNVERHYRKFLSDARDAQHKATDFFLDYEGGKYYPGYGLIPSQAPCYIPNPIPVPGMGSFYDIIPWGSSIIIGTYWDYMFYGNKEIIEENYGHAKRYLNHLESKINGDGFIAHGLGDWGNPKPENLARENIETAFLYADYRLMMIMAREIGRTTDMYRFMARAEMIKDHYNRVLLKKDPATGRYGYTTFDVLKPGEDNFHTTQAALALPLYLNMVPDEYLEDVIETFKQKMIDDGGFITGEVGQSYIIRMMSRLHMNDLICKYILKEEHPSYYAFIKAGETSLGEYWENNPRSHNHDMLGHIIEWYYAGLAGIRPLSPGFKKIEICPYLPDSMNHLKASYKCPYGTITVEMNRREDGSVKLDVSAPEKVLYTIDRSQLD